MSSSAPWAHLKNALKTCPAPMADAVKECPSCALDVEEDAEVCPYCQYEFPTQKTSRTVMAWVMALLLAWPLYEVLKLLFR